MTVNFADIIVIMDGLGYSLHEWCVAGSAVVSPRPSDVDIWIFTPYHPEAREAIISRGTSYTEWIPEPGEHGYPFYRKITLRGAHELPVQFIFVSEADRPIKDVYDLVNDFDLSCHAAAWQDGKFVYHPAYTGIREQIQVLRWTTPHSTLRRLFLYSQRYDTPIPWTHVEQLCREIVRLADEKGR